LFLKGKRATTHWAYHHFLPLVGATPVHERVVRDENLFTGGGVTAGIDFGFTVLAELSDDLFASSVQRTLEYDPQPPFPRNASEEVQRIADKRYEQRLRQFELQLKEQRNNTE
jgi:cyclohexyl-isocyanide hydratase